MRPVAVVKKLFLWCEALVLMDRNLLPEERYYKSLCPGWEGSTTILPADLRVLEACRSWRWQIAVNHLLSRANDCSLPLPLAAVYQMFIK